MRKKIARQLHHEVHPGFSWQESLVFALATAFGRTNLVPKHWEFVWDLGIVSRRLTENPDFRVRMFQAVAIVLWVT